MRTRTTVVALVTGAIGVVTVLAGCDQITADRTWDARVASTTSYKAAAVPILRGSMPIVERHDLLSGPLLDAAGRAIPGSAFREDCVTQLKGDRTPFPGNAYQLPGYKSCSISVSVSGKIYVAASHRAGPFDTFQGLGYSSTITVRTVDSATVSVRLYPKPYQECSKILRSHDNGDGTITYTTVYPNGQLMQQIRPDHTWDPATAPNSLISKLGIPRRPSAGPDRTAWIKAWTGLDKESPNFCVALGVSAG